MKSHLFFLCVLLLGNTSAFASWDDYSCQGSGCGFASYSSCNPWESNCQCTDPACGPTQRYDTNCLSRGACCEAFGNIGAS